MVMKQRFWSIVMVAGLVALFDPQALVADKAPFKILYSNDTTNILTNTSPWHAKGRAFNPAMITASVIETADTGVDAHFLQPGMGWVPWWSSRQYPYAEHVRWMAEHYGLKPPAGSFAAYMANGGDMVSVFVAACRQAHQAAFISLRMNDGHRLEDAFQPQGYAFTSDVWHAFSKFYVEHPDWRIGPSSKLWENRVLDWRHPEVPAYRLGFVTELCEGYDLDGIELDFMRYYSLFDANLTPLIRRVDIVTGFVRQVRAVLDRTAKSGTRRWLCVRIPDRADLLSYLGLDIPKLAAAGVDMFNLSSSYFTDQSGEFANLRRLAPEASFYLEMTHSVINRPAPPDLGITYDDFTFRRTTDEQFRTTSLLARQAALDGVSLFNFAYFREHAVKELGPFNEPPFHVLAKLTDQAWLEHQAKHYFTAGSFVAKGSARPDLPLHLKAGQTKTFTLRFASDPELPPGGGFLRILADRSIVSLALSVKAGQTVLVRSDQTAEPYSSPYVQPESEPDHYAAFVLPAALMAEGTRNFSLTVPAGAPDLTVFYADAFAP